MKSDEGRQRSHTTSTNAVSSMAVEISSIQKIDGSDTLLLTYLMRRRSVRTLKSKDLPGFAVAPAAAASIYFDVTRRAAD